MQQPIRSKLNKIKARRLTHLANGNTAQEVAAIEHVELTTIKSTIQDIKQILSARNITHAVCIAIILGEISIEDIKFTIER